MSAWRIRCSIRGETGSEWYEMDIPSENVRSAIEFGGKMWIKEQPVKNVSVRRIECVVFTEPKEVKGYEKTKTPLSRYSQG